MTYKYVLKWRTGEKSKIVVEAWPSSPKIALALLKENELLF